MILQSIGRSDHRRLNLPAGLALRRSRREAGVRQGHGADEAWDDSWDDSCNIRQLALGAWHDPALTSPLNADNEPVRSLGGNRLAADGHVKRKGTENDVQRNDEQRNDEQRNDEQSIRQND